MRGEPDRSYRQETAKDSLHYLKVGSERVFMLELRDTIERAVLCCDQQNRRQPLGGTPIQRQFAVPRLA
jgi:hypothetical protein